MINEATLQKIIQAYPNISNPELASTYNKSISQIKNLATKYKLKKSTEYLTSSTLGTKGMKGIRLSPNTEFKKGNKPFNTKFNGCISLRFDSKTKRPYKWIRIENNKWVLLHRYLYQKYNETIPEGCIIYFKDGNSMNLNIENIIPIKRSQLLSINRYRAYNNPVRLYKNILNNLNKYIKLSRLKEETRLQRQLRREARDQRKIELKLQKRDQRLNRQRLKKNEKRRHRMNRRRIATDFVEDKITTHYLMELGEKNVMLAKKFMGDIDQAKDAIMNAICYFIESNIETNEEEFIKRLIYDCKLLKKDSYKMVSYNDLEYKLAGTEDDY